jgi:hypothetical protein
VIVTQHAEQPPHVARRLTAGGFARWAGAVLAPSARHRRWRPSHSTSADRAPPWSAPYAAWMSPFASKPIITGERVVLRPIVAGDAQDLWDDLHDPDARRLTGTHATFTRDQIDRWCATRIDKDDRLRLQRGGPSCLPTCGLRRGGGPARGSVVGRPTARRDRHVDPSEGVGVGLSVRSAGVSGRSRGGRIAEEHLRRRRRPGLDQQRGAVDRFGQVSASRRRARCRGGCSRRRCPGAC